MTPRSKVSATVVGSVAVACAVGVSPPAALFAEGTNTVSAPLLRPLKEAQADLKAQKYDDAISKLKAAEAVNGKAPYDQHLINDLLAYAYLRTQDYASAAETIEAEVDDGLTPPADQAKKIRALAALHYHLKNYDKAIEYGWRAIKGGHGDDEMQKVVGQAYYLNGDWKAALDFEEELVSGQIKRGETPAKESLQLFLSACVKLQDNDCERRALELLNGHYPNGHSPGVWRPDLKAPQPPQWGTVMAFFFGGSEDLVGQKRPATAQRGNNEGK